MLRQIENDKAKSHEGNMFEHQNNEKIYKTNKKIYLITFINNHYVCWPRSRDIEEGTTEHFMISLGRGLMEIMDQ